ncbi:MAG: cyclic pyranopterin monophosphate synthase MoaC [Acidobacteriota bacterium]
MSFSHIDDQGRARMVDISHKKRVRRTAVAEGKLFVSPQTADLIRSQSLPKGEPFEVARIAGIQAAKQTARLIPLCHDISLDFVDVQIELSGTAWTIRSTVACRWATGVEMEALTAVSVAALTLYDMCKAVDKQMTIGEIRLVSKEKESSEGKL